MPLEMLAPLVAAGIALTVFLVWWLADAPASLLDDAHFAAQCLQTDFPEIRISRTILAGDSKSALMQLEAPEGMFGLVSVFGSHHITRLLAPADIRSASIEDGRLQLSLADFTCPSLTMQLGDGKAEEALAIVNAVVSGRTQGATPVSPLKEVNA